MSRPPSRAQMLPSEGTYPVVTSPETLRAVGSDGAAPLERYREHAMDISLAGRSAVVTGGSKGIGFAIASRFAASGADVAIVGRGREALDEAVKAIATRGGGRVVGIQG